MQALAYVCDYLKRSGGFTELEMSTKVVSGHEQVLYTVKKAPAPLRNRDFLGRQVWRKESPDSFLLVCAPTKHTDYPERPELVHGRSTLAMKITARGENAATVEYVVQIDFGGVVPAKISNQSMGTALLYVTRMQEHFQATRPLHVWDKEDGKAVGVVVCIKTEAEQRHEKKQTAVEVRVTKLFKKFRGLKEAGERYAWFQPMLTAAAQNILQLGGDVEKGLGALSVEDGEKIGKSLASELAGTKMGPKKAVDAWIRKFPALVQLNEEEAWFRPMVEAMARKLVSEVGWGARRRLCVGERSVASVQQQPPRQLTHTLPLA